MTYEEIAEELESEGYYAFVGGYITPTTDSDEMNEAITKILDGLKTFNELIEPYRF